MTSRRRLVPRLLVVLGSVLAVIATLAIWVDRQVLNTDHWTQTSAELLRDKAIQDELATYLSDQVFSSDAPQQRIAAALPPRLKPLAGPAASGLSNLSERIAKRMLASGAVQQLWVEANRITHAQFVALTEGKGVTVQGAGVVLDLRPLLGQLAARVGLDPSVVDKLPPRKGRLVVIKKDQLDTLESLADFLRALPIVAGALALLAFGGAIALGGERSREVLRNCGIGLVVAGLLVLVLRRMLGNHVVDAVTSHGVGGPAASHVWSIGTSLLASIAWAVVLFGAIVLAGAWFAGEGSWATRGRRYVRPILIERPGTVYGMLGVVLLVVLVWGPFEATRSVLGALVFTALAGVGALALDRQIRSEATPST